MRIEIAFLAALVLVILGLLKFWGHDGVVDATFFGIIAVIVLQLNHEVEQVKA